MKLFSNIGRRFAQAFAVFMVAIGLVGLTAVAANATHPTVEGKPYCDTATGMWVVKWTVGGDTAYPNATATIKSQSLATIPTLVGKSVKNTQKVEGTQTGTIAPNTTYTQTVKVQFDTHPQGSLVTQSGSVKTGGDCKKDEPNYYLETSNKAECGKITITLRNVSPWIYPVSYSTDGSTPNANGPKYGPVVDNRGEAPDDQTKSITLTFPEDSGVVTVKYVVAAGTEDDLYMGKPVGQVTTVKVETDCQSNDVPVVPADVTFYNECATAKDTYTIPTKEGVEYLVNNQVVAAGTYPGLGSVTVTARAKDKFVIKEGATTQWNYTFPNEPCPTPPVPPVVDVCPTILGNQPVGTICETTPPPVPPTPTPEVKKPTGNVIGYCVTANWGEGSAVMNNKNSTVKVPFRLVRNGKSKTYTVKAGHTKQLDFTGLKVGTLVKLFSGGKQLDRDKVGGGCTKPPNTDTGALTAARLAAAP